MIFANIDSTTSRNIVRFECGTKAQFEKRHLNDPLWIFLDYNPVVNRSDVADFLKYPTQYYIDPNGNLRKHNITAKQVPNPALWDDTVV